MRNFVRYWIFVLLCVSFAPGCGGWRHRWDDRDEDSGKLLNHGARSQQVVGPMIPETPTYGSIYAKGNYRYGMATTKKPVDNTSTIEIVPQCMRLPPQTEGKSFSVESARSPTMEHLVAPERMVDGYVPAIPVPPQSESIDYPVRPAGAPNHESSAPTVVEEEASQGKEQIVVVKANHIKYGATDQFQTVTGQVQQWRKTWRLRYAPVEQEDAHGGSVVLQGSAELNQLRDGQHVRVRGVIIPADDHAGAARYHVQGLEILD